MPTCSQYKKVTVITDPLNPEQDLLVQANGYGKVVSIQTCSDGFVYLILLNEEVPSDTFEVMKSED